jgi:hypothetical protein
LYGWAFLLVGFSLSPASAIELPMAITKMHTQKCGIKAFIFRVMRITKLIEKWRRGVLRGNPMTRAASVLLFKDTIKRAEL